MDSSKFLIIGAGGQVGLALRAIYPQATAMTSDQLDITNKKALGQFDWSSVSTIINAAAYTSVDDAETSQGRRLAWRVNASGTQNLALIASKYDLTLVHVSTDYVFDDEQNIHSEVESFAPLSVYGQSKAAGDIAASMSPKHYLIRTSWVIGNGRNFISIMQDLAEKGAMPTVVNDQIGRLTFTHVIAEAINHLLVSQAPYGTYNCTNSGTPTSWAEIARFTFEKSGRNPNDITAVTTDEYNANKENVAPRPHNSILSIDKLIATGFNPTDWRHELENYLNQ